MSIRSLSVSLLPLAVVCAALSACGGGSSDPTTSDPNAPIQPSSPDPIDKYIGTFKNSCSSYEYVRDAVSGELVYFRETDVFRKMSSVKATFDRMTDFYDASDCSGTARYTMTISGQDNFLIVDGTETVSGKVVDKATIGVGAVFPGLQVGASLTVQGITLDPGRFGSRTATSARDILYLDMGGALFDADPNNPLPDAQGYPTVLDLTVSADTLKKQ